MSTNSAINIIHNHDFSRELDSWHPNCCEAYVDSSDSKLGRRYVVVKNRKKDWQGLEQEITSRVSAGSTYMVSAHVGISRTLQGSADVEATLRLEYRNRDNEYLSVKRQYISHYHHVCNFPALLIIVFTLDPLCRSEVWEGKWENLQGTFALKTMPDNVVFYLEGPPAGVDLLIGSVMIYCSSSSSGSRSSVFDASLFHFSITILLISKKKIRISSYSLASSLFLPICSNADKDLLIERVREGCPSCQ